MVSFLTSRAVIFLSLQFIFYFTSFTNARQAPICVDQDNNRPRIAGLDRFTWIFDFYKQGTYIPVADSETSPSGMITFKISGIQIDDTYSGYKDVLRNWVHIHVKSEAKLEALYVQAISSPWGIPFGEFITSFDCTDCPDKTSDSKDLIHIVPCLKRPALAFTHPNVFTIGGKSLNRGDRKNYFKDVHFNFRYTQYPGVDHTYAQFLVIAVRSFKGVNSRFETFFTQIYELDVLDNPSGAYYPFFAGWETEFISCHSIDTGQDFKPWSNSNSKTKLRYNPQFDACILEVKERNENLKWLTCPPGPMIMKDEDVPLNLNEWRDLRKDKYSLTDVLDQADKTKYGDNAQICPDGGIWEWTIGEIEWSQPQTIELDGDSIKLTEVLTAELSSDIEGFDCDETGSVIECTKVISANTNEACADYQTSTCDRDDLSKFEIIPFYGKDYETGKFILNTSHCSSLTFTQQLDVLAMLWGNRWILALHGKLMIFAWTAGWNVIGFCARFMKEYTMIERRSSYFGIGGWLWNHIIWTHITGMAMFTGIYLMAEQHETHRKEVGRTDQSSDNLHDICNLHTDKEGVYVCLSPDRKIHNRIGLASCFFFFFSYLSGWTRPVTRMLRVAVVCYHFGMAYAGKVLFYILMFYGYQAEHRVVEKKTFISVVVTDVVSLVMYILATIYNCYLDKKYAMDDRKMFPVPEGIDTFDFHRWHFSKFILPVHILIQLFCFFYIQGTFEGLPDLCIKN